GFRSDQSRSDGLIDPSPSRSRRSNNSAGPRNCFAGISFAVGSRPQRAVSHFQSYRVAARPNQPPPLMPVPRGIATSIGTDSGCGAGYSLSSQSATFAASFGSASVSGVTPSGSFGTTPPRAVSLAFGSSAGAAAMVTNMRTIGEMRSMVILLGSGKTL